MPLGRKGFTLLEVVIVVIIIGLLAAIALPQYTTTLNRAKAGEAYTNLGALRTAMDRYYYDQIALGSYTQLSGATWYDSLDIEIELTSGKWTYTVTDSGSNSIKSYVIRAENKVNADLWVTMDQSGAVTRSSGLGG